MSNLIPIKICELAIENLNKRIAELETENNRLRAETTRTIIPESSWIELKDDYAELEAEYNDLSKAHQELLKNKIPPTSEYQKLVDKNCELKTEANFWREEYGKLLIDFNLLKQCPRQ